MLTVSSGQTLDISAGESSAGVEVMSGGILRVLSGGTAGGTFVEGGTEIVNAGGTDFFGGEQIVAEGGTAGSPTVSGNAGGTGFFGGEQIVAEGGRAGNAAVSGSTEIGNAGGTDPGALISASEQDVSGLASGGTVC